MSSLTPLRLRIRRSLEKNLPEMRALATAGMPPFVLSPRPSSELDMVPVFCFHDVEPTTFEEQLRYLRDHGYVGLTADEALDVIDSGEPAGRRVALTFDDATWTFWAIAFPLLRRYGFPAILFAVPGLVPDDDAEYPTLDDLSGTGPTPEETATLGRRPALCTWRELRVMQESGLVDVQSHSLTHQLVPVSPTVLDFLNPDFDPYHFGNVQVPITVLEDEGHPTRQLRWGMPLFDAAPRLSGRRRFVENPELVRALTDHVTAGGGPGFFSRPDWRGELKTLLHRWPRRGRGEYETKNALFDAIHREVAESRRLLEVRLGEKTVRHLCYPWFIGSPLGDRLAQEAGYRAAFYGVTLGRRAGPEAPGIRRVLRLSEEYLLRLPGGPRRSLLSIWKGRLSRGGWAT